MTLNFFDFEVFRYNWMVVIANVGEKTETVIVDDPEKLKDYYDKHKNDIWVGFNSRNYDQYILKGILCGFDPYKISQHIIEKDERGWSYSRELNKIRLYNFDIMTGFHGLKTLEGFMGNDIQETSVPFDIDRKLTPEEISETIKYCRHDVEQTMKVFIQRKTEFDSQMSLIKTFNLPLSNISKSQAQLSSIILEAKRLETNDEWDIRLPDNLVLKKYKYIADWFMNKKNHSSDCTLTTNICGVPHVLAWGGLHGAIPKYQCICKSDELMIMADVAQLYPSIMLKYNLLSRSVSTYDKMAHILSKSLELKALGKKKEREPYKRICNIVYGSMGDPSNAMYDPLHRTLVCVYGQVLIVMLLEMLEKRVPSFFLQQSNTDGILFKIKRDEFDLMDDVMYEWECITQLRMEYDYYAKLYQKDVNNYVAIDVKGKSKCKGAYVKSLSKLDYDLPIVNKALVNYMSKGTPVETTINECDDLIEFQKIVKVSSKYSHGYHNGKVLNDKTFRVFASTSPNAGAIYKVKDGGNPEKFANTPERCFTCNIDINGAKVPDYLDKQYYIDLAIKRLNDFGIEV